MRTRILVAGLACLSVVAVAQQSDKKKDPSPASQEVKAPRDQATGQASGRGMNQQLENKGVIHRDLAAREASSGMATGKAADSSSSADGSLKRVAAGDVNGDDTAAVRESPSKSSLGVRESPSKASIGKRESPTKQTNGVADVDGDGAADKVKSPRDAATGQSSGKRQH